jgi:hypothetical protein
MRVQVNADHRGGWEIVLPDHGRRISCNTLDDARRVAFVCAAHAAPCHLIVRDAYDRVIEDEVIAAAERRAGPPHASPSTVRVSFP